MTTSPERPEGPFSGLLVVDMTHVLAGPFATTILNDLGARVVKIEPGQGDDTRTYGPFVDAQSLYFSFVNRGKESIVLNLKEDTDRDIFLNMVRNADVLTENFRPGTMDKLGFSYHALSAVNPRLIYASSSGYGQTGPLKQFPVYDTVIQAMSGIMSVTGFPDGPPTRVGTSMADLVAGVFLVIGVASALYARQKTGKGARVDVAMFDAMLTFLEHGVMEYVATGRALDRIGNRHPFMAPFDTFDALDGSFAICAGNDKLFAALCQAIGRPERADQPQYKTNADRMTNHEALKAEFEVALARQPVAYWLQAIQDAGVPVAPILDVAAAVEHPQTKARNMMIEAGGVRMLGNPVKIDGYHDPTEHPGAPELDQHGEALRKEFAQ